MVSPTPHARWRAEMPVIDAHTHLSPALLDRAVAIMEANGLAAMVSLNGHTGEQLFAELRQYARYPGRFYSFAGVDFTGFGEPNWARRESEALERAVAAGAVGLKLHKSLGLGHRDRGGKLIPVDDERLAPIFDQAGELGVPVAFHTADPKAFFEPLTPDNERWEELSRNPGWWFGDREKYPYDWWTLLRQLEKVVARHPHTTIIGVHFGNAAEELDYLAGMLEKYPHYLIDTAARIGEIGRHDPQRVREVFMRFSDRILFGTDLGVREPIMLGAPQDLTATDAHIQRFYQDHWRFFETAECNLPHPIPIQGHWTVRACDLPREVLERLYFRNAQRWILGR